MASAVAMVLVVQPWLRRCSPWFVVDLHKSLVMLAKVAGTMAVITCFCKLLEYRVVNLFRNMDNLNSTTT